MHSQSNRKISIKNKTLGFIERGNGFPQTDDIVVDHAQEKAYKVLPDTRFTGHIETGYRPGDANTTVLNVMELNYEDHYNNSDAWEI
jgi:hypothetical protein